MKQIWTVGTLIVKDLNGRYIYRIRQTRITTLNDKTIYVAKEYFKLGIFIWHISEYVTDWVK